MKLLRILFISILCLLTEMVVAQIEKNEFTDGLLGEYFGEQLPEDTPKVFAHKLLSKSINTVFSPDGNEFFFVRDFNGNNEGDIQWMRKINGQWTLPVPAPFNNNEYTDNDICISHDGKTVYFRSWRIIPRKTEEESASHIWYSKKINGQWSEAKLLEYNGKNLQAGYSSMAKSGNLYYPKRSKVGKKYGDLFFLRSENGKFVESIPLNNDPENLYYEGDMCVAPDESYAITSCWNRPDSISGGESDLYVTFHLSENKWSRLINLGSIVNSEIVENCPTLSPDGKYFFFMRYDGQTSDAFWMKSDFIDKLRPKE